MEAKSKTKSKAKKVLRKRKAASDDISQDVQPTGNRLVADQPSENRLKGDDDDGERHESDEDIDVIDSLLQEAPDLAVSEESQVAKQPPKKKRKRNVINKYSVYCKKYQIPYPEVNFREKEHMDLCHICQELWPMYLFKHEHTLEQDMATVVKTWCELTEKERGLMLKDLRKEQTVWLKDMTRTRVPSGYQLFLKEKQVGDPALKALKFGDRTTVIAGVWSGFSAEEKKTYSDRSDVLKAERKQEIEALPVFKRKLYDREKRRIRAEGKANRTSKPSNSFMLYLKERWNIEKSKSNNMLKYRDVMNVSAKEWETFTAEQKSTYRTEFLQSKEAYLIDKKKVKASELKKANEAESA